MFQRLTKFPKTILKKYNQALINSPYKTKMATAGFTYFVADGICQNYVEKRSYTEYSPVRSFTQASVGAFFAAPSLHIWHSIILPKMITVCSKNFTRVLLSVFLNETVLATYFISCLLFSFEALKTLSVEKGTSNVQKKFLPAIEASIKFWTPISFINYGFVPIHMRPVFVSCWSMVWQTYLSYVSNNKISKPKTVFIEQTEEISINVHAMKNLKVF